MANILIMAPTSIANIGASRGTGIANLLRPDPKEIWQDSAAGSAATIDVDFGAPVVIDTVFLGAIMSPALDATWTIAGGLAGYTDTVIKASSTLRVPDRPGRTSLFTHAFWHGDDAYVRYLRLTIIQPAGNSPLAIGVLMAGIAFQPGYNLEWGAGRGIKDTGTATRLPSGGISVVEGARYGTYKWTLGDLTDDEADYLYELQLDRGETRRVLVVENPDQTPGLRSRIHYGLLTGIKPYERRNPAQTTWDFQIEDWISEGNTLVTTIAIPVLTLSGDAVSFGGEILTIGN